MNFHNKNTPKVKFKVKVNQKSTVGWILAIKPPKNKLKMKTTSGYVAQEPLK